MSVYSLCDDCPPAGYPTDRTRCLPCPRRTTLETLDDEEPAQTPLSEHQVIWAIDDEACICAYPHPIQGALKFVRARSGREVGDIVQIVPHHKWGGCLAVVDDVRAWGVVAYVRLPHNDGSPAGDAYTRLAWADFQAVGKAVW